MNLFSSSGVSDFVENCPENEAKQQNAMQNVREYLEKMISKELTRSGVFHTLLRHYMEHAHLSQIQELYAHHLFL
jgi:hypothetical protein